MSQSWWGGCNIIATLNGRKFVTDPWGKVMKQLDEKEGILIEEIDLDREDQIREQLPLLKHRKSEMYHL